MLALALMLLAGCYPDDDKIFEQYADTFKDPADYDPENPDPNSAAHNPYVDLGLTSGLLWAEYNIGAKQMSEKGESFNYSPYIVSTEWGNTWSQPTSANFNELISECTWEQATIDGVAGYKAIGPNENFIFFPKEDYWTSTATAGFASVFIPGTSPRVDKGNYEFSERCYVRAIRKSDETLELSQKDISVSAEPQTKEIPYTSSQSKVSATSDSEWLSVSVSNGKLTLSIKENTSSTQRTAKVFVEAGKLKRKLTVLQDATNNFLELSTSKVSFSHKGGQQTVKVTTGGTYKAEPSDESWLSVSISGGELKITAVPNSTLASKEASVTVTTGSVSKSITVTQSAASQSPTATITSVNTSTDKIELKGSYDAYDASIQQYGIIYTYSSSSSAPDLTLDSYKGISRSSTSSKRGNINFTLTGNGSWYGNKNYYFFRIYVRTTDGCVYYSDVSKGVVPTSK